MQYYNIQFKASNILPAATITVLAPNKSTAIRQAMDMHRERSGVAANVDLVHLYNGCAVATVGDKFSVA